MTKKKRRASTRSAAMKQNQLEREPAGNLQLAWAIQAVAGVGGHQE